MTSINSWTNDSVKTLNKAGITSVKLDVLILLEDLLNTNRTHLLAHPEIELTDEQIKALNKQITRRANHEPLAYIRGKTEFYGREFLVNNHTLEPRPETETMIELLLELVKSKQQQAKSELMIADIGTGSGSLAITTKLEIPNSTVIATDIDKKCLNIAQSNATKHDVDIEFLHGNLLEPLSNVNCQLSALLCNLPYVPDSHKINQAAKHEPKHAIFGGPDGLELYRQLFTKPSSTPYTQYPIPYIMTESLPEQHTKLLAIAKQHGYELVTTQDFIQVFQKS